MKEHLKLSELNQLIRQNIQDAFPGSLWVIAEISELKVNYSGHCYIELIEHENDEIVARIRATIWSYTFRMLKPYFETSTGQQFTKGIKVLVNVTVEFHPAFGLSLNIKDIDPAYTLGDLAMRREKIINQLKNEGIFDMNRELPLPLVPQRIAVISSSTAAGYQDFTDQLQTNPQGFRFYVKLFEAVMQGDDAVNSIIRAFDRIFEAENEFDCVAIIRGGGAAADLNCFDNYDLACTVAQFSLPVFTGIGHEKDDTIVDMVAHTKLKTPTAVAEFLILGVQRFKDMLEEKSKDIFELARQIIENEEMVLSKLVSKFSRAGNSYLSVKNGQISRIGSKFNGLIRQYSFGRNLELNRLIDQVSFNSKIFLQANENRNKAIKRDIKMIIVKLLTRDEDISVRHRKMTIKLLRDRMFAEKQKLKNLSKTLVLLNPENILQRGFTLTLKDGRILKTRKGLWTGDEIETVFIDGKVKSEIKNIQNHDGQENNL